MKTEPKWYEEAWQGYVLTFPPEERGGILYEDNRGFRAGALAGLEEALDIYETDHVAPGDAIRAEARLLKGEEPDHD